jgi:hypothetical protein
MRSFIALWQKMENKELSTDFTVYFSRSRLDYSKLISLLESYMYKYIVHP